MTLMTQIFADFLIFTAFISGKSAQSAFYFLDT